MSEHDSFIDEVTEAVRRDKLFASFRKYGWIAIAGVVLLVGGAAFNEFRKSQAQSRAEGFGDSVSAALKLPEQADQLAALGKLATADDGQATVLALVKADAGDIDSLKSMAKDAAIKPIYRDLANLKLLILNVDGLDAAKRTEALQALTTPGAPFRLIALEQIALIQIETGAQDKAIATFQQIAEDSETSPGLQKRAKDMLMALGGGRAG